MIVLLLSCGTTDIFNQELFKVHKLDSSFFINEGYCGQPYTDYHSWFQIYHEFK